MKFKKFFIINLFLLLISLSGSAQTAGKAEIKYGESIAQGGKLFVTVAGKQRKIADNARDVWIINQGKEVIYSYNELTRGFEGEGENLVLYNVKTGKKSQVMAESTFVTGLSEVKLSNGSSVLVVALGDGGLGGSYLAVVDPRRGQILQLTYAEVVEIKGDKLKLAYYTADDWEAINQERSLDETLGKKALAPPTKVKPQKTEILDLKTILKNKVIINPTNREFEKEFEKKTNMVDVFLWMPKETTGDKGYALSAVSRDLGAESKNAPLSAALKSLFTGVTQMEEATGFSSSTFGMKFEGVVLKNGIASVKFSQPKGQTNHGSLAPFIFLEAIEKTAKQFPTVKKVEVCAIGDTLIDAQLEKQFPRCQ